jgi:hypothetical protein
MLLYYHIILYMSIIALYYLTLMDTNFTPHVALLHPIEAMLFPHFGWHGKINIIL